MEAQNQPRPPHDLDVFELLRSEVNVLLNLLAKLPYTEVAQSIQVLTTRQAARPVTDQQLEAIKAEIERRAQEASKSLAAKAVNTEAQADMSEASSPSEEEIGTEQ